MNIGDKVFIVDGVSICITNYDIVQERIIVGITSKEDETGTIIVNYDLAKSMNYDYFVTYKEKDIFTSKKEAERYAIKVLEDSINNWSKTISQWKETFKELKG